MSTFKYGRRKPSNTPAIKFGDILKSGVTLPPYPVSEDAISAITGWQMLGNDTYGDCVAVTWANQRYIVTSILGTTPSYPNLTEVETFYKTQNPDFPSEDNGMDIQTALNYLVKSGGPDGTKALAFAKVDFTNLDEVKAALSIFGMVWIGINVLDINMTEFNDNQPWDYSATSAVDGGHSVVAGGYLGQANDDVRFVTWAAETAFTDSFWSHQVEEAWVVIWPEHLGSKSFQAGIDQAQLASDYAALTGGTFPVNPTPEPAPTPSPTPTPQPVPTPTPQPVTVVPQPVQDFYNSLVNSGWLESRHTGSNKKALAICEALFEAYGL